MKIPFTKKKEEENMSETKIEERVAELDRKFRKATNDLNQRTNDLNQRTQELEKRTEEAATSTVSEAEKSTKDDEEMEKVRAERNQLQQQVETLHARLSDKKKLFSEWFENLGVEDKVKLRDAINKGIPEAEKEDTARVEDEVGDPEFVDSLDNVANPQNFRWAEQMGCFVNIEK